jgi:hypothetical protein
VRRGKPARNSESYVEFRSGEITLWVPGDMEFTDDFIHVTLSESRGRKIILVDTAILK